MCEGPTPGEKRLALCVKENYIDARGTAGCLPVNESLSPSHAAKALDATHDNIETAAETNDDSDFALLHRRVAGGTTYKFLDGEGGGGTLLPGMPGAENTTTFPPCTVHHLPSALIDRSVFPLFLCDPVHLHIIELHRVVLSVNRVIVLLHARCASHIGFRNMAGLKSEV